MSIVKPGRPRTFDRDEALREAMETFWARGYGGASLSDLQAAMGGIAAPSLYAAFGSKDMLFREAIELYSKSFGVRLLQSLDEAPTAREGVAAMLRAALNVTTRRRGARGCLIVLASSHADSADAATRAQLKALQQARRGRIRERIARGMLERDVPRYADVETATAFYTAVLDGVCNQARTGTSRAAIEAAIEAAMRAWPAIILRTS